MDLGLHASETLHMRYAHNNPFKLLPPSDRLSQPIMLAAEGRKYLLSNVVTNQLIGLLHLNLVAK